MTSCEWARIATISCRAPIINLEILAVHNSHVGRNKGEGIIKNIFKTIAVSLVILSCGPAHAQWGFISEVTKPEEGIICDADITRDTKYKTDLTEVVVVERIDKETIKLGIGTRLQLAVVPNAKGEMVALMLLGYPGPRITLQPGTSVEWNKMTLRPGGGKAVTFVVGERNGKVTLEKISGTLTFERKGGRNLRYEAAAED